MNSPGSDARFCDSQIENASSAGPSRLAAFLSRVPEGAPVAIRADGAVMTDREFLIEAGRWRDRFQEARQKTTGCCRRTRVVMHSSDTTALLPALFGAWSAGVETMLTGDALPGTLARMRAAAMVEPGVDLLALDMAAFAGKDPAAAGLAPVAAPETIDAAAALETPVPFFGVLSRRAKPSASRSASDSFSLRPKASRALSSKRASALTSRPSRFRPSRRSTSTAFSFARFCPSSSPT